MRQLALHISALNDDEYEIYTSSFNDLALNDCNDTPAKPPHDFYEKSTVGVREIRAWMRGRFSTVQVAKIDEILKLFCPNMGLTDTVSGEQFFAALRLMYHVSTGKDVDRTFAFVQAQPKGARPDVVPPASPPKRQLPIPPLSPGPRTFGPASDSFADTNPFATVAFARPAQIPSSQSSGHHNPFVAQNTNHIQHGHPSTPKIPPLPPRKPSHMSSQSISLVPPPKHASQLLSQGSSISPPKVSSMSEHVHRGYATSIQPAKPLHVTSTLMRQSLQASKVGQTMKKAEEQLEKERILRVLKSSNPASPAPTDFTRGRSLSPHKPPPASSSSSSDIAGAPPLPRRRTQTHTTPPSPPFSTTSLEQVAMATPRIQPSIPVTSPFSPDATFTKPSYFHRSPSASPSREGATQDLPPPKHPRRKPPPPVDSVFASSASTSSALSSSDSVPGTRMYERRRAESPLPPLPTDNSPTSRVYRSRSVHYPSPPPPPVPPPLRRRRPESVQVLGSPSVFLSPQGSPFGARGPREEPSSTGKSALARHVSMSATTPSPKGSAFRRDAPFGAPGMDEAEHDRTPLGNIQRTLATLQPKLDALQPRLEKVRYKAEAGLSRRGFVRDGRHPEGEDEEGLIPGGGRRRVSASSFDDEGWERVGVDSMGGVDVVSGDEGPDGHHNTNFADRRSGAAVSTDRDNLKWPAGEGWRPL
ncbi:hypothetical protein HGRIS_014371 [Hohenbuehelia grisea]|uniref:EH domain-containing protein n=1 Tax=Hohenbuehelia grisea TaxID=104357 RepID=A0ABR3JTE1_9AGAR